VDEALNLGETFLLRLAPVGVGGVCGHWQQGDVIITTSSARRILPTARGDAVVGAVGPD
jgi:hypothetical protein